MAWGAAAAAGAGRRREVVGGCRARHKDAMRHRGVDAKLLEATARSGARPPDQIELGRAERAGARARWSSALPKRDGARRAGDRTRRSGHVRGLAEARPRRIRRRPLRVCTHLAGIISGASEAKFTGTCISSFTCTARRSTTQPNGIPKPPQQFVWRLGVVDGGVLSMAMPTRSNA